MELCPILSQTPVGDLCILQRQPKILEASNLRPDFRNNMVSSPPPQPIHIQKALFLEIPKRYNIPLPTEQHFSGIQPTPECMCNLCNLLCNGTDGFRSRCVQSLAIFSKIWSPTPPQPVHLRKPLFEGYEKRYNIPPPPLQDTIFREISRHWQNLLQFPSCPPHPTPHENKHIYVLCVCVLYNICIL